MKILSLPHFIACISFIFVFLSCQTKENKIQEKPLNATQAKSTNIVDTMQLTKSVFHLELISNGRLRAFQKSDLSFEATGMVQTLRVKNGDKVKKGELIAQLDVSEANLRVKQMQQALKKAKLELQDALLGFGYRLSDSAKIPSQTMQVAMIRSGYEDAVANLEIALMDVEKRSIRAPFSGKLAYLQTKVHEKPKGDFFCTLINDESMDVEFTLIESELGAVSVGQKIKVAAFFDPNTYFHGKITSINPSVDKNGQISIFANIPNAGKLIDGMSVKVFVEKEYPNSFVVPKTAVLFRDNREMLFTYKNGKANWVYVITEHSNSHSHAIIADTERRSALHVGDIIITGGNLNLGDGSEVEIRK